MLRKFQLRASNAPVVEERCAYCHERWQDQLITVCPLCGTMIHRACESELDLCPTLGCPTRFRAEKRAKAYKREAVQEQERRTQKVFESFTWTSTSFELYAGFALILASFAVLLLDTLALVIAFNIGLVPAGIFLIVHALQRRHDREAFLQQGQRLLADEPRLVANVKTRTKEGENAVLYLREQGFEDLRLREYLLGKASGRIKDNLFKHLERRRSNLTSYLHGLKHLRAKGLPQSPLSH